MPDGSAGRLPLSGNYQALKQLGFEFDHQAAGSHEIWFSPETNRYTPIPNHPGDMPEGTLRAIFKQAGVEPEVFVQHRGNGFDLKQQGKMATQEKPARKKPGGG